MMAHLAADGPYQVRPKLESMKGEELIAYARQKAAGETPVEDTKCLIIEKWMNHEYQQLVDKLVNGG